jgi:hypothetical protein
MVIQPDSLLSRHARQESQNQEYWLHECYRQFAIKGDFSE